METRLDFVHLFHSKKKLQNHKFLKIKVQYSYMCCNNIDLLYVVFGNLNILALFFEPLLWGTGAVPYPQPSRLSFLL